MRTASLIAIVLSVGCTDGILRRCTTSADCIGPAFCDEGICVLSGATDASSQDAGQDGGGNDGGVSVGDGGTADGGSDGGTCDVVTNTGCPPTERCGLFRGDGGDDRIACVPRGPKGNGDDCGSA